MLPTDSQLPPGQAENPYKFITGLAEGASTRSLTWLLGSAVLFGAAFLALNTDYWPLSAIAGTLTTIALWGLLAHRAQSHPSLLLVAVQRLVVAVGSILALGAALAILYGILGPRWML